MRYTVACIPNIGQDERHKRRLWGTAALGMSVLLTVALAMSGTDRRWRLVILLPLWIAALGVLQAREKT